MKRSVIFLIILTLLFAVASVGCYDQKEPDNQQVNPPYLRLHSIR